MYALGKTNIGTPQAILEGRRLLKTAYATDSLRMSR